MTCAGASFEEPELVVDRSTTGLNLGGFDGRFVDGRPAHGTRPDVIDELKHLAKVRVAGSNPVVPLQLGLTPFGGPLLRTKWPAGWWLSVSLRTRSG